MADGSGPILAPGVAPADPAPKRRIVWFAGGGGSSVAVRLAFGEAPSAAANHWPTAIAAHQRHFPETEHYCGDVFDLDPASIHPGEDIAFGWFSPDCTDFSKAKGKALRSERRRGLAWIVVDWARERRIPCIMVENVWEFTGWGPLYPEGHPQAGERIPEREGETFAEWVQAFRDLGYQVDWWELCAADYGAPTTRNRFYFVARCDGGTPCRPPRTHAPRKDAVRLGLKPWRGACEVIDWSIPCPSIFLTPEEVKAGKLRVKRPLVKATLSRVARGIDRFVIRSADPFIAPVTHQGDVRVHDVRDPLRTATAAHRGELAVVDPFIAPITNQTWGGDRAHDAQDPLKTITTAKGGEFALVQPSVAFMSNQYGSNTCGGRGDLREPSKTLTSANHHALVSGALVRTDMQSAAKRNGVRDVAEPMAVATTNGGIAVTSAYMVPRYGERDGQQPRALDITEPHPTVVPDGNGGSLVAAHLHQLNTHDVGSDAGDPARTATGAAKSGLVAAHLVRQFGSTVGGCDVTDPAPTVMADGGGKTLLSAAYMAQGNFEYVGRPVGEPLSTVTQRATQQQLVAAQLQSYYKTGGPQDAREPMAAATSKARRALTAAFLEQANTGMVGHDAREPASTIVLKGCTQRLIEARLELEGGEIGRRACVLAFLWSHFGAPTEAEWVDPLATIEGRLKFGLVLIKGQCWMIVDIGLRMLVPAELAGAMGLPPEFDLTHDIFGHAISKTDQTHLIGNMVSPPPAVALMRANCPDALPLEMAA